MSRFQSTLSVRRATVSLLRVVPAVPISIHALREESDDTKSATAHAALISIHALREESDQLALYGSNIYDGFQSTLSVRRATESSVWRPPGVTISIHALREESDFVVSSISSQQKFQSTLSVRRATRELPRRGRTPMISIHALREESDDLLCKSGKTREYFNPRSP